MESPEEGITNSSFHQANEMIDRKVQREILEQDQCEEQIVLPTLLVEISRHMLPAVFRLCLVNPCDKQADFGVTVDRINQRI